MKVAYLLGSLNRGGAETLLLDTCCNAKQNKLDALVVHRKTGVLESDFCNSGVQVIQLKVGKNIIKYLFQLRKIFLRNKVELVHAQQPIDALFALIATVGLKIPLVLTFHGFDYNVYGLGHFILAYIIKRTNANVYVSDNQRQHYSEKYKLAAKKQKVIYNGISFIKLDKLSGKTSLKLAEKENSKPIRDELQLSSSTLLLISVGNFVPGRDQQTLCRFIEKLKFENVDFHFIFVGKGVDYAPQYYNDCVNYCEQHCLTKFVGFVGSRTDVPQLLAQADCFIYSTHHDTFGIAVVEAMAVGIPVFVNDWSVMSEVTANGKYATLYKTKDENDLLREFMLFLQNKAPFELKAKEASNFVRSKYSIENHINDLKKVYSSLL